VLNWFGSEDGITGFGHRDIAITSNTANAQQVYGYIFSGASIAPFQPGVLGPVTAAGGTQNAIKLKLFTELANSTEPGIVPGKSAYPAPGVIQLSAPVAKAQSYFVSTPVTLDPAPLSVVAGLSQSQTVNLGIVDRQTTSATIAIGGSPITEITSLEVIVDLNHTFVGDLTGILEAPDGTQVTLFSRNGSFLDDYKITLSQSAGTSISSYAQESPVRTISIFNGLFSFDFPVEGYGQTGTYRPIGDLNDFNGIKADGNWTLSVTDSASIDQGVLNSFELVINGNGIGAPESTDAKVLVRNLPTTDALGASSILTSINGSFNLAHPTPSKITVDLYDPANGKRAVLFDGSSSTDLARLVNGTVSFSVNSFLGGNVTTTAANGEWTLRTTNADGSPGTISNINLNLKTTVPAIATIDIPDFVGDFTDVNVTVDISSSTGAAPSVGLALVNSVGQRVVLTNNLTALGTTTFDDDGGTGNFLATNLDTFTDRSLQVGTWQLEIVDYSGTANITLNSWSLDFETPTTSIITVKTPAAGVVNHSPGNITDLNVIVNLDSTDITPLSFSLSTPGGAQQALFGGVGSLGDTFVGTILDDEAGTTAQSSRP
jgi:subtilisin-like proprotein convertase family protein